MDRQAILETERRKIRTELARISSLSPEQLARERGAICPHCLRLLIPQRREYTVFDESRSILVWPDRCGCPGEREAKARDEEYIFNQQVAQAREKYLERLRYAGLDGLLADYTFDSFIERLDWPVTADIRSRVESFADMVIHADFCNRPWLILHGRIGTGKSHLAGAVIRKSVDSGLINCFFRVWPRYLARLQASWDRRKKELNDDFEAESESDIVAELTRGRIVVIDDLDKRSSSEWARGVLFDVLNTRYNGRMPTILTFNHDLDSRVLLDYVGGALLDRIAEHAFDVIEFSGTSYRLRDGQRVPMGGKDLRS